MSMQLIPAREDAVTVVAPPTLVVCLTFQSLILFLLFIRKIGPRHFLLFHSLQGTSSRPLRRRFISFSSFFFRLLLSGPLFDFFLPRLCIARNDFFEGRSNVFYFPLGILRSIVSDGNCLAHHIWRGLLTQVNALVNFSIRRLFYDFFYSFLYLCMCPSIVMSVYVCMCLPVLFAVSLLFWMCVYALRIPSL